MILTKTLQSSYLKVNDCCSFQHLQFINKYIIAILPLYSNKVKSQTTLNKKRKIFSTFNNDIDKITAKIGIFGKSINDITESLHRRRTDIYNAMNNRVGSSSTTRRQAIKENDIGSVYSYVFGNKSGNTDLIKQFEEFNKAS